MLYLYTLTWNGLDKLTKLKNSLLPALEDVPYKWFIKDNDSNDNTYEVAKNWGTDIHCIKYKNNLQNFSQGMNYLFHESSPKDNDIVCLLNNDVIINDKISLKNMLKFFKNNDVGIVGGRLLYTNTNKIQHAGVVFNQYKSPLHFRAKEESDKFAEKNRYFQVVTGAVLMIKAIYFKNAYTNPNGIKGMDENLHWGFDDVDLCLSTLYKQNKKVVYCGETNIYHDESASLKKNPANHMFLKHNLNCIKSKWSSFIKEDLSVYTKNKDYNLIK